MITLKQMEALVWVARLGTFDRAARKLFTTQSAVSKRIRELELALGVDLFDRARRGASLTKHGELLLGYANEMLDMQSKIMRFGEEDHILLGHISIGVTELSALTWFPRLITKLRNTHGNFTVTPVVDASRMLLQKLVDDELDIVVVAGEASPSATITVHVADVESVWMAQPGLVDKRSVSSLNDLLGYPILAQGSRSGTGNFYKKWLKSQGFSSPNLVSDNLIALVGLTVAGLGVCYLPYNCYKNMLDDGKLEQIEITPSLPDVPYYAVYKSDRPNSIAREVTDIIKSVCDFSQQFQI
jgi:DNA-binding transcriptional LysR family regulator